MKRVLATVGVVLFGMAINVLLSGMCIKGIHDHDLATVTNILLGLLLGIIIGKAAYLTWESFDD